MKHTPTSDVLTIRNAVLRARSENFDISEYAVRRWVAEGRLPVLHSGNRALIYYPSLLDFLRNGG